MNEGWRNRVRAWFSGSPTTVDQALQEVDGALEESIARQAAALARAAQHGPTRTTRRGQERLEALLTLAQDVRAMRDAAKALWPVRAPEDMIRHEPVPMTDRMISDTGAYWVSSSTLAEAHAFLTQRAGPEWMLAVSGLRINGARTLETLIQVRLKTQSFAQASFEMGDYTRLMVALGDHGQALHAVFHSHRMSGRPQPSSVDQALQRVLDEGGYPAIQAVFSEDGHVRFFAHKAFTIHVYGKGVDHVQEKLYRITAFSTLPHPGVG